MRRDRVAVLGEEGLFQASLMEALATQRWFEVQSFSTADPEAAVAQVSAFQPHVVLVVRSSGEPVPQAVFSQMEKGVPILTLDPKEPAMTFSFQERKASTTLDRVLEALRAARPLFSGRREGPRTASRGKRDADGGGA
ncbi:MAG: hypothetical protein HY680_10380 [Chloroflexi bacterium]|nr:hypothetical protein [Chloroflexota bacterium]